MKRKIDQMISNFLHIERGIKNSVIDQPLTNQLINLMVDLRNIIHPRLISIINQYLNNIKGIYPYSEK